jgi:hypothetical protein
VNTGVLSTLLVWALESNSELQRRDIHQLLAEPVDLDYIRKWAPNLGVTTLLNELMHERHFGCGI